MKLLTRMAAGAAVATVAELALGRRAFLIYQAARKLTGAVVPQPQNPEEPTLEEAMREVRDRGQAAFGRGKTALRRTRERLESRPQVAAALAGGATIGVLALGAGSLAVGAGAAYVMYRKLKSEQRAARGPDARAPTRPASRDRSSTTTAGARGRWPSS